MGIGAGIFMLALGAIITFAFNIRVGWLDLDVVGWVLMGAGALGLIMALAIFNRRRTTVVAERPTTTSLPTTTERVAEERAPYDVDRPL